MDGGMIGVMKEERREGERQMDHHDHALACVCVCGYAAISTCPPASRQRAFVESEFIILIMSTIHTGLYQLSMTSLTYKLTLTE